MQLIRQRTRRMWGNYYERPQRHTVSYSWTLYNSGSALRSAQFHGLLFREAEIKMKQPNCYCWKISSSEHSNALTRGEKEVLARHLSQWGGYIFNNLGYDTAHFSPVLMHCKCKWERIQAAWLEHPKLSFVTCFDCLQDEHYDKNRIHKVSNDLEGKRMLSGDQSHLISSFNSPQGWLAE